MDNTNTEEILQQIRSVLRSAEVPAEVVESFVSDITAKANTEELPEGTTPEHHIVKLFHEQLAACSNCTGRFAERFAASLE